MDDTAFRIFRLASQGYCCTQILIKMALEEENKENEDLIRAVNGLCGGIGFSGKACGALSGSICVLGLYAGKGNAMEYPGENYMKMLREFTEWFEQEFESTECREIVGVSTLSDESGNINYPVKCGDILVKCYEKVQEILYTYEYDFGDRENYGY